MYNYSHLPSHMRESMRRYVENHIAPGSFLTAILANDFITAAQCADSVNEHYLFAYAAFLYNELPPTCYGSYEIVREWLRHPVVAAGT